MVLQLPQEPPSDTQHRVDGDTQRRLISAIPRGCSFSAPHPTGSPWSRATRSRPTRRDQLVGVHREGAGRIEAGVEAGVEVGEVRAHAQLASSLPGSSMATRTAPAVSDRTTVDMAATSSARRGGSRASSTDQADRVTSFVEHHRALGAAGLREAHLSAPTVARIGVDGDELVRLEPAQEPARVARIQVEAVAQRPDLSSVPADAVIPVVLGADLPPGAGRAERPPPRQVFLVEHADPLRDDPVEPSDDLDPVAIHIATFVKNAGRDRPNTPAGRSVV